MDWPTTFDEALAVQQQLRAQVRASDDFGAIRTVAGVDAGYEDDPQAPESHGVARAAVVVLEFPSLRPLDYAIARRPTAFPYVPGFLSFRETPAVLAALEALRVRPDLLICDGQGIAHPRRFGIACHIGLLADLPAIGCAKSLLTGRHGPLPDERGATVPLINRGEQIGVALRSRAGTKPLYISIGHRISLPTAIEYVLACLTKYRLPETTRAADGLASHGRIPNIAP
ncbi:MAG TPA: deoxyribonuclease V [Kouleothrix sp.]|nr:deoxyribonuclease V [Kouleothrix sp.]HRC74754.1 deoxyribonuclease V [Kouleothrix sp.]